MNCRLVGVAGGLCYRYVSCSRRRHTYRQPSISLNRNEHSQLECGIALDIRLLVDMLRLLLAYTAHVQWSFEYYDVLPYAHEWSICFLFLLQQFYLSLLVHGQTVKTSRGSIRSIIFFDLGVKCWNLEPFVFFDVGLTEFRGGWARRSDDDMGFRTSMKNARDSWHRCSLRSTFWGDASVNCDGNWHRPMGGLGAWRRSDVKTGRCSGRPTNAHSLSVVSQTVDAYVMVSSWLLIDATASEWHAVLGCAYLVWRKVH